MVFTSYLSGVKCMDPVNTVLSNLKNILPTSSVLTGTAAAPYLADTLRPSWSYEGIDEPDVAAQNLFVVLPQTTEEVAEVVRMAFEHRIPVVPYGSGTGLMGGAAPIRGGIVIDMKRMDRVLEISKEDMWAKAEAGIVLGNLNTALGAVGLILGHDPWTQPAATLGGAISTNGLGYLGYKYGSMGQQVLGLEAVLPNGQILTTSSVPQASSGLPLKRLFIGTEGVFGIITRATIRAFPAPQCRRLLGYRFDSFELGFGAVQQLFFAGLEPSLLDFGEEYPHLSSVEGQGVETQHVASLLEVIVYLGFEGLEEHVNVTCEKADRVCRDWGSIEVSKGEVDAFWDNRHWHGDRSGWSQTPSILTDYVHVALPPSKVPSYRDSAVRIIREKGVHLREFGLWNQPSLFSVVVQASSSEKAKLSQCIDALLTMARDMEGSIEYCHGVGLRISRHMEHEMGVAGMELLRSIKSAVDPYNIMNPGKWGL
ncbi:MAG: FAD-binding oxidoreductase [Dehalococcoidia bacterium]|nr:FAD-binding oxidoreductase [Dehalococcoidia bacterium]